jgi:hypothetical protein
MVENGRGIAEVKVVTHHAAYASYFVHILFNCLHGIFLVVCRFYPKSPVGFL